MIGHPGMNKISNLRNKQLDHFYHSELNDKLLANIIRRQQMALKTNPDNEKLFLMIDGYVNDITNDNVIKLIPQLKSLNIDILISTQHIGLIPPMTRSKISKYTVPCYCKQDEYNLKDLYKIFRHRMNFSSKIQDYKTWKTQILAANASDKEVVISDNESVVYYKKEKELSSNEIIQMIQQKIGSEAFQTYENLEHPKIQEYIKNNPWDYLLLNENAIKILEQNKEYKEYYGDSQQQEQQTGEHKKYLYQNEHKNQNYQSLPQLLSPLVKELEKQNLDQNNNNNNNNETKTPEEQNNWIEEYKSFSNPANLPTKITEQKELDSVEEYDFVSNSNNLILLKETETIKATITPEESDNMCSSLILKEMNEIEENDSDINNSILENNPQTSSSFISQKFSSENILQHTITMNRIEHTLQQVTGLRCRL